MEQLYTPWRLKYLQQPSGKPAGCLFCTLIAEANDAENLIVLRGVHNFIIMNRFPYNNGHVMVVPYQHTAQLPDLPADTLTEMMQLGQRILRALEGMYHPHGFNLGMNLGEAAGAGVPQHLHLHILPRWMGDTSFMSTVGETRVLPEELPTTYEKLVRQLKP